MEAKCYVKIALEPAVSLQSFLSQVFERARAYRPLGAGVGACTGLCVVFLLHRYILILPGRKTLLTVQQLLKRLASGLNMHN